MPFDDLNAFLLGLFFFLLRLFPSVLRGVLHARVPRAPAIGRVRFQSAHGPRARCVSSYRGCVRAQYLRIRTHRTHTHTHAQTHVRTHATRSPPPKHESPARAGRHHRAARHINAARAALRAGPRCLCVRIVLSLPHVYTHVPAGKPREDRVSEPLARPATFSGASVGC